MDCYFRRLTPLWNGIGTLLLYPGQGAGLPYIRYIGLCGAIRYCFRAVWTEIKCGQELGMILGRNCFCDGYYSSLEKCDLFKRLFMQVQAVSG